MKKIIFSINISLDGYIAKKNGDFNWLLVDESLFDFIKTFTDDADTAIYGRKTYEMMESYWTTAADKPNATRHDIEHSKWYNDSQKIVISRTLKNKEIANTTIFDKILPEEINKLKNQDGKNLLMFGSVTTAQNMMKFNLIDEYLIFINPILLGAGIPLFKNDFNTIYLSLLNVKTFESGVIALHYQIK